MSSNDKRIYIDCDCSNKNHTVVIEWTEDDEYNFGHCNIYTQLVVYGGFFERLKKALMYVLNFNDIQCYWHDTVVSCPEKFKEIKEFFAYVTKRQTALDKKCTEKMNLNK
jgi:hypothetical protein